MSYADKYRNELDYIDKFWDRVTVRPRRREKILNLLFKTNAKRIHKNVLSVPKSFVVPNDKKFTHVFYWDTFFMFRGLMRTKREWIMRSMVDNFIYLYEKYGVVPNFNSPASTGRSQPPLLTSMILDVYVGYYLAFKGMNPFRKLLYDQNNYKRWLKRVMRTAEKEYFHVWMDPNGYFHHNVKGHSLSRYGDRDIGYAHSAELESGWDFTSRFYNRCNEFLPIDLNVFLFKYERDFSKVAALLKDTNKQNYWQDLASTRKEQINKYMWNEKEGFFFDYGYLYNRQSDFYSLAGFTPLWAGLASAPQAKKMVKHLSLFETENGLTITAKKSLAPRVSLSKIPSRFRPAIEEVLAPKQWDYPNIWPPLEYLTIVGLLKYGYVDEAKRIMKKSLAAQSKIFKKYGTFFEKIDGVTGDMAENYHYENQAGFGWTNASFFRYVNILDALESKTGIYQQDRGKNPPFKLAIPH